MRWCVPCWAEKAEGGDWVGEVRLGAREWLVRWTTEALLGEEEARPEGSEDPCTAQWEH